MGGGVANDLHHLFHGGYSDLREVVLLLRKPVGGKANKVGGEAGQGFLQLQSGRRADFEMVHFENVFAFLNVTFAQSEPI